MEKEYRVVEHQGQGPPEEIQISLLPAQDVIICTRLVLENTQVVVIVEI